MDKLIDTVGGKERLDQNDDASNAWLYRDIKPYWRYSELKRSSAD